MSVDLLSFIDRQSNPYKTYPPVKRFIDKYGLEAFESTIQDYTDNKYRLIGLLEQAVSENDRQMVQSLLYNGPKLKDIISNYDGLLLIASRKNNRAMVEMLLDYIHEQEEHNPIYPPNYQDYLNDIVNRLLKQAIEDNRPELVHIFLRSGANPNQEMGKHDEYLLDYALYNNKDVEIIADLLRYGANPNQGQGLFWLGYVKGSDQIYIADQFLQAGADVNRRNYDGDTILFHSMYYNTLKYFLDHGADPNIQNKYGKTALMSLLEWPTSTDIENIRLLIHYGANPYIRNNFKWDAFYYLNKNRNILKNYTEVLDILNSFEEQPIKSALEFDEY